jgi:hypothetical protein
MLRHVQDTSIKKQLRNLSKLTISNWVHLNLDMMIIDNLKAGILNNICFEIYIFYLFILVFE